LNAPPPPDTPPLSLHDALPICTGRSSRGISPGDAPLAHARRVGTPPRHVDRVAAFRTGLAGKTRGGIVRVRRDGAGAGERRTGRSEEHTSELQSLRHLVCRLLL